VRDGDPGHDGGMIVILSPTESPRLTDHDRLDRLHAELDPALDASLVGAIFDDLCSPADDDHVWLAIAVARAIGCNSTDAGFGERFDPMIAYASSKGWTNEAGTHVRAHIERTG
jgi:hypothetical protein